MVKVELYVKTPWHKHTRLLPAEIVRSCILYKHTVFSQIFGGHCSETFPSHHSWDGNPVCGCECVSFPSKSHRVSNKVSCSWWKSATEAERPGFLSVCLLHVHKVSGFDLLRNETLLVLISFKCNLSINQQCFWREKWELNTLSFFFMIIPLETNNVDIVGGLTHWQEVIIKRTVFLLPIKSFLYSLYMCNLHFISTVNSENNKIKIW